MTTAAALPAIIRLPMWLIGVLRDLLVGTVLCLSPLTALLALGWMTRRMGATVRRRWGKPNARPGWLIGPRDRGWIAYLFGGFAANIRNGVIAAAGLALLCLPFTVLWLGAWWAGWENSFNKGYEQATIGPAVWFLGALISVPLLTHLPLALAHAAVEGRFAAFFEWRRIRSLAASSGWRIAWIALLSVALSVPFFGLRAIPVFIEGIVPEFADMTAAEQAQIAQLFDLAGAALAFVLIGFLRQRAANIYAIAVPRAANGRSAHLWTDHPALGVPIIGRAPSRAAAILWLVIAGMIWFGLPVLMVIGQFMNYDPVLWLTHPVFLLPWSG
ncbi:hypothetical protein [Aliiroseovarius sp. YM-037]|uniref:hypothetical protein n=1 Tax=Aliiroseovarius sp. YM-037 TaxID=3341728 RepID=UPI003A7FA846